MLGDIERDATKPDHSAITVAKGRFDGPERARLPIGQNHPALLTGHGDAVPEDPLFMFTVALDQFGPKKVAVTATHNIFEGCAQQDLNLAVNVGIAA